MAGYPNESAWTPKVWSIKDIQDHIDDLYSYELSTETIISNIIDYTVL